MKNIVEVTEQPWVKSNIWLRRELEKLEYDKRIPFITDYIVEYALAGPPLEAQQQAVANELIQILWPTVVLAEEAPYFAQAVDSINVPKDKQIPLNYSVLLDLKSLTPEKSKALDKALEHYASILQGLIAKFCNEKEIPSSVVENLGYELLSATHLMRNLSLAKQYFAVFLHYFVGYRLGPEKYKMMNNAPEILRNSLKETPYREDRHLWKSLLSYLLEIDKIYIGKEMTNGLKQTETLGKISKIVCISFTHNVEPKDLHLVFMDITNNCLKGNCLV